MRLRLPHVVLAVLLLTSCGTQSADTTSATSAGPEVDGVRITGTGRGSVEFEVTNREAEPFTYTITFDAVSDAGAVLANTEKTVPSVRPNRTVTRTLPLEALRQTTSDTTRVRIAEVRRVPTSEAPAETGPCPSSGVRLTADDGDAAMGLRAVGLHLENCGTRAYRLDGYPRLTLLDEDREPVSDVRILHGSGDIATMEGFDTPPRPLTLHPGDTATAGLLWRNTTAAGPTPVHAPYARVRPKPGAPPVTVTPELDLGTTGELGVSPWRKGDARGGS